MPQQEFIRECRHPLGPHRMGGCVIPAPMGDLGLSPTQAAEQLSVEGYPNLHGRVRWYTKAARDTFEAGR